MAGGAYACTEVITVSAITLMGLMVLYCTIRAGEIACAAIQKCFIHSFISALLAVGARYITSQALGITYLTYGPTFIHSRPTISHAEVSLIVQVVARGT